MALFKVFHGNAANLSSEPLHEGYIYFARDENKFFLDIANDGGTIIRRALNSEYSSAINGDIPASPEDGILYWDQTNKRLVSYLTTGGVQSEQTLSYLLPQTTLAGYGITDAKISSGSIILGSNVITPVVGVSATSPIVASVNSTTHAIEVSHANSGVTAGEYVSVTVNALGHVVSGTSSPLPLSKGGTGATTAAAALSAFGVTATAAEINVLDGITATTVELNYVDGVTSNIQTQLNNKSDSGHTHNYAGSASTGGAAYTATALTTSAGSATQPIYFSGGKPVATSYTLNKTVPSDAVFTDTTYSAATTSVDGLMSASDKVKLNGIETGAEVNTVTGVKGNSEPTYRTGAINITAANIGLGNVDNTADTDKPVSTAQQTALNGKANTGHTHDDRYYTETETDTLLAGIAASSHNSLADLQLAGTTIIWGHINDQTQTIYGVKTFNDFPITPSTAPISDYEVANKKYVDDNIGTGSVPNLTLTTLTLGNYQINFNSGTDKLEFLYVT